MPTWTDKKGVIHTLEIENGCTIHTELDPSGGELVTVMPR